MFVFPAGPSLAKAAVVASDDPTNHRQLGDAPLGLSSEKVLSPRFSYIEKMEYRVMVWGTILMGLTGFVLWFDNISMGAITKLGFDVARTIHFYEAILATLAIIVWHFYWVIYNPEVYPMNLAWLTGRMSEKEMLDGNTRPTARKLCAAFHRRFRHPCGVT